jgi:hypothetical protein
MPATCAPFYAPLILHTFTCTYSAHLHLCPFCVPAPMPLLFCTPAPTAMNTAKHLLRFTIHFYIMATPLFLWAPPLSLFLWWGTPPTVVGYPTFPVGHPTGPFFMVGCPSYWWGAPPHLFLLGGCPTPMVGFPTIYFPLVGSPTILAQSVDHPHLFPKKEISYINSSLVHDSMI